MRDHARHGVVGPIAGKPREASAVSPEPDPVAVLVRWALASYGEGEDVGAVLAKLARDAYELGLQRRAREATDDVTPTVDVWAEHHDSQRPTMPAPGLPSGVARRRS